MGAVNWHKGLITTQMLIYIFQEHLHQFTLLLVIIQQKCEEILILLIPGNQGILYGIKIGEPEIL